MLHEPSQAILAAPSLMGCGTKSVHRADCRWPDDWARREVSTDWSDYSFIYSANESADLQRFAGLSERANPDTVLKHRMSFFDMLQLVDFCEPGSPLETPGGSFQYPLVCRCLRTGIPLRNAGWICSIGTGFSVFANRDTV